MISIVVFDSSTLVSAAVWPHSIPAQAVESALNRFSVCGCLDTLSELEEVLSRAKFAAYLPASEREKFLGVLYAQMQIVSVSPVQINDVHPRCRDIKDNIFLALASVAQAEVIVTSDADLLVLHPWNGVDILTPSQFLAKFDFRSQ